MILRARHGVGVLEMGVYEGIWLVLQGQAETTAM
jgi:hypothetical protein